MYILGISAFFHDSAASLIKNGEILSCVSEERFTRKKFDASFPINAVKFCLDENNLNLEDIDEIVFFEKPFIKFERLIKTYIDFFPKGFQSFRIAMPIWAKEKLFQKKIISDFLKSITNKKFDNSKLKFSEHHFSHAASAFYPSPFEEAAIVTMDGVGEFSTTTIAKGVGTEIIMLEEIRFPDSIGLLYSAFTYFLGFKVNSDEYKVMGLAPYGKPKYVDQILDKLIDVKDDGSFKMNQKYFEYATGLVMTNSNFEKIFDIKKRDKSDDLEQKHKDLAASIQKVCENIILKIMKKAKELTKSNNLCLAGGVALNCVANGKIYKEKIFNEIWIQPAAGDAGGALGAALLSYYQKQKKRIPEKNDSMKLSYLGPAYNDEEVEKILMQSNLKFKKYKSTDALVDQVVIDLENDNCVGWFQDRMEYGPRALGNRSILGDPRKKNMQSKINLKIKFRESFRPFAPIVLEEEVSKWFEYSSISKYMLMVSKIKNTTKLDPLKNFEENTLHNINSKIPAVTHVDGSARLQTISKENGKIHLLLNKFFKKTGCPILVNTSFNLSNEPIVCSPSDAIKSFLGCNMEILVINNFRITKD